MLLEKIVMGIDDISITGFRNIDIKGITDNSKEVSEDFIFVAINGNNTSGINYIKDAVRCGANVIVAESDIQCDDSVVTIKARNARKTLAEMLNNYYNTPDKSLKIIGITGTKGKTTTAEYLYGLLKGANRKTIVIGTLGTEGIDIGIYDKYNKTTPDSKIIFKTLDSAVNEGYEFVIIEVSSQALLQYRVWGIKFKCLIFTSFSSDHIGSTEHKSIEEYYLAKKSLFSVYPCDFAITNSDDERGIDIVSSVKKYYRVGEGTENEYKVCRILSRNFQSEFQLNGNNYRISLSGIFNVYNASLALACASELIPEAKHLFPALIKNITVNGRYERYFINGKRIIIDFAHNGLSFAEMMKSVKECSHGRIIVVYGSVGERVLHRRRELAQVAEYYADFSIITTDNPGNENTFKICNEIYSNYVDKQKVKIIPDRRKAIEFAIKIAWVGDNILLLGKGHEEYDFKNGKREYFSEREFIISLGAIKEENR